MLLACISLFVETTEVPWLSVDEMVVEVHHSMAFACHLSITEVTKRTLYLISIGHHTRVYCNFIFILQWPP